jgi:hypothetical protein
MNIKKPGPLQAGFWLTVQERRYILIICALFFIGLAARYYHLTHQQPDKVTAADIGIPEQSNE